MTCYVEHKNFIEDCYFCVKNLINSKTDLLVNLTEHWAKTEDKKDELKYKRQQKILLQLVEELMFITDRWYELDIQKYKRKKSKKNSNI
tara:strand:+ start:1257 stop:1523 length:267 start_codon:yes stop_codon:yes gene_type:complete